MTIFQNLFANVRWQERYTREAAFINGTAGLVNVRTGPGTDRPVIGQLAHREGGYIRG